MKKTEPSTDGRRVTIWLPEGLIARADRLAEKAEMERGRLLRNIIEVGVETLEDTQKVGLLQVSLLLRDMAESLKGWVASVKKDGLKKFWSPEDDQH
jgi:hypothetical protein